LGSVTAGRNVGAVGRTGAILAHGDINAINIPKGTLYNDIRSGEKIQSVNIGGGLANLPGNQAIGAGSIIAMNRIGTVTVLGDFGGDIRSFTGGIGTVTITNGSFLPGRIISAADGSVESLTITGGSLLGSVHADFDIVNLKVDAGSTGG